MSFTHLAIHLKYPICKCKKQNLAWNLYVHELDKIALLIRCKTCRSELRVAYENISASFYLERGYPVKNELGTGYSEFDLKFLKSFNIKID